MWKTWIKYSTYVIWLKKKDFLSCSFNVKNISGKSKAQIKEVRKIYCKVCMKFDFEVFVPVQIVLKCFENIFQPEHEEIMQSTTLQYLISV